MIFKSAIFEEMWEVREDKSNWMIGIGSSVEEAEYDASYYDGSDVILWESPNMKNKLPTWELTK